MELLIQRTCLARLLTITCLGFLPSQSHTTSLGSLAQEFSRYRDDLPSVHLLSYVNYDIQTDVTVIAAVPCFFTGPLFGHLADKYGSEFVMTPMFAAVLPWLFLLLSDKSLPLFVAYYAITSESPPASFVPTQ